MNNDPLDLLDAFYEDCRMAPVPETLAGLSSPAPWWLRLSIPLGGLTFGGLLALLLVSNPATPSQKLAVQAAHAIAQAQFDRVVRESEDEIPAIKVNHVEMADKTWVVFSRQDADRKFFHAKAQRWFGEVAIVHAANPYLPHPREI